MKYLDVNLQLREMVLFSFSYWGENQVLKSNLPNVFLIFFPVAELIILKKLTKDLWQKPAGKMHIYEIFYWNLKDELLVWFMTCGPRGIMKCILLALGFLWEAKTPHEPRFKDLPCPKGEITLISELSSISYCNIQSGDTELPCAS